MVSALHGCGAKLKHTCLTSSSSSAAGRNQYCSTACGRCIRASRGFSLLGGGDLCPSTFYLDLSTALSGGSSGNKTW